MIVTLTTDFGTKDAYVASMKGVICSIASQAKIVDISHEIPPQDILKGSLVLEDCFGRFPKGTVHVAVIDPGVGTSRKALIVEGGGHVFVGPDNGLFSFARHLEGFRTWKIREDTWQGSRSATFDGRDLFAPIGAKIANGTSLSEVATRLTKMVFLNMATPSYGEQESVGEVVDIDRFGNLVSNLFVSNLTGGAVSVDLEGKEIGSIQRTYNDVPRMNLLALENSMGRLEIAVSQGSAQEVLKASRGMKVRVRKVGNS